MMKIQHIIYITIAGVFSALSLSSCNDFLDVMPDNRTVLDSEEKIADLLTTSYPNTSYILVAELMSDNSDYYGDSNPNGDRFGDQAFFWKDITESNNDGLINIWSEYYTSIAQANQALESIKEMGENTDKLKMLKGEALLCRAYCHFILVNMFCQQYNAATSEKDMGIPYSDKIENLEAKHDRGTVAGVYDRIDQDLQEGLSLVGDNYSVPKYHFNINAAFAFATRFYLYYEKFDQAIICANRVFDTNTSLRDWVEMGNMTQDFDVLSQYFIKTELGCNLMLSTYISSVGAYFGDRIAYTRYAHGGYLGNNEDVTAPNIWGRSPYYQPLIQSGNNYDVCRIWKLPFLIEYTDAVSMTGYAHTVVPLFTTDETLLNRAEAYILTKQYDLAAKDLDRWIKNAYRTNATITKESIQNYFNGIPYSYSDERKLQSTVKKHLNPAFQIDEESSVQECMLQLVLDCRRIQTMHEGLRWFDVKRYGIEIPRRLMGKDGKPQAILDILKKDDKRRAIQLPIDIITAGLPANPR